MARFTNGVKIPGREKDLVRVPGALSGVSVKPTLDAPAGQGGTQPVVDTQTPTGFQYQHEDAYQRLLRQAASQGRYQYDPSTDPVMQAYTRAYRREGERAAANALAKAAAATGGVPSSYAVGAAQQAGAYYSSQLADKIPELEQQAYERYLNERAMGLQGLETLGTDREDAYSKYLKQLAAEQEAAALSLGSGEISAEEIAQIKVLTGSNDGKVTSPDLWGYLTSMYTEEQLAAAGITYAGG